MPTSHKTFREVKGLLDRLERSIDDARVRRLGGPGMDDEPQAPPVSRDDGSELDRVIGRADDENAENAAPSSAKPASPSVQPDPAPSAPKSKYGRAKPIARPADDNPTGAWRPRP